MSSLIPAERGLLWDIQDVVYGNEEKERKPVQPFLTEMEKYPGLLDIIISIVGLVNKRSSHASGVVLYDNDPFETAAFMKTPGGDLITCYDLHLAEAAGDTKYDFLVTEVSDKLIKCIELLQDDGLIEQDSLRNIYNKYLHPEILNTNNTVLWDHLEAGDILDVFQFNEGSGLAIAKKLRPRNVVEMMSANALMRLMSERDTESQQDRYLRIKTDGVKAFDKEMRNVGLDEESIKVLHKHCDDYYGCVPLQEQMMEILMEPSLTHFTLGEANAARKIVAKKKMKDIPKLREQVFSYVNDDVKAQYIWDLAIRPSLGYAFSKNHSLPYSFVGIQTIELATRFNPIYWNTACLIINSGSLEEKEVEEEIVDIYDPEMDDLASGDVTFEDLPDRKGKIKRTISTDYGKIAKALGDIRNAGIKISLIDINKSDFGFKPDVENNQILFGLKAALNLNDDTARDIIKNRPYISVKDFVNKVHPKKQTMISLIKGGAFDNMMDRKKCMVWYIWETCDKKSRLTMQNMSTLIKMNMLPKEEEYKVTYKVYEFNRYLKSQCAAPDKLEYNIDHRALMFLYEIEKNALVIDNKLNAKRWDKVYQGYMDTYRKWLNDNQEELLQKINDTIFLEDWNKYALGTLSAWEMTSLCFYYHAHELATVNNDKYGFADFYKLPEEPVVDRTFWKGNKEIHLFKLCNICGTCIAKNKTKSTISLLTTTGVVTVKFSKEYFAMYDKQISELGEDGKKHVRERSWFNRGTLLTVMGMRSGDDFLVKKYSSTPGHRLYQITEVNNITGDLVLKNNRYGQGED